MRKKSDINLIARSCGVCHYAFDGQCMRFPPQRIYTEPDGYIDEGWPSVKKTDFCFEFKRYETGKE